MKKYDGHETAKYFRKYFPDSLLVYCSGIVKPTVVLVSSLGMLSITFYSLRKNEDNAVLVGCVICFMMVLIGNILLFSAFTSYMENMYVTIQQNIVLSKQEADINHYRQIMKNNESYYEFIHNIKHQLKIIGLLANEKNYPDIIKVINELDQNVRLNELIVYSKDSHILNIILSEYRAKSVDKGIDYDVYIEPGIHGIGIKSVNGIAEKYGGFLECYTNKDIFDAILVLSTVNV